MCMNDTDLLQLTLVSFITETSQDMITLGQLVEQQDQEGIMEMSHKLAGRIGQVGNMALSVKLRKIEKTLKQPCDLSKEIIELNLIMKEIQDQIEAVEKYSNQSIN